MRSNNARLFILLLSLALLLPLLAGCASIIKGSGPQSISLKSNPSDAKVEITDLRTGSVIASATTPYIAMLNKSAGYFRSAKYKVVIDKPGYQPQELTIEGNVNGWYILGNFVFGGLIGWLLVDPATGAMWSLLPEDVSVDLIKQSSLPGGSDGLMVMVTSIEDLPEGVKAKLRPVETER